MKQEVEDQIKQELQQKIQEWLNQEENKKLIFSNLISLKHSDPQKRRFRSRVQLADFRLISQSDNTAEIYIRFQIAASFKHIRHGYPPIVGSNELIEGLIKNVAVSWTFDEKTAEPYITYGKLNMSLTKIDFHNM